MPRRCLLFPVALAMLAVAAFAAACGDDDASPAGPATDSPATDAASSTAAATPVLPTRDLSVSQGNVSVKVVAEIAASVAERQRGLMLRQTLPEDAGMLFLFPGESHVGFWMKDTLVPLTIAYLDGSGTVLELRDGKPEDTTLLTPAKPYRYVLEVNQGWFQRHGLGVGAMVRLPADLPAAQ